MSFKRYFKRKVKERVRRIAALQLALLILFQAVFPTGALALGSGPSQPEVQSFEPVGTSDMVDLFSGDFNYNIPLLDVEGYPINISYHSGITMDQEASMVGLGWNINPGVVNRGMRGIPDDFNGEEIVKTMSMRPNRTYGVAADAGFKVFGYPLGFDFSYGIRYNNYTGVGIEKSANVSFSVGATNGGGLSGNLGITSSSDEGLTLQGSIGLDKKTKRNEAKENTVAGFNVGSSFNSRGGLKQLSINVTVDNAWAHSKKTQKSVAGKELKSFGSSYDFGMPTYTPQVSMPMSNFAVTARFTLGEEFIGWYGHVGASAYYSGQKLAQNEIRNPAYGYFNSENGQSVSNAVMDFNREKDIPFTPETPNLPVTNYTFDTYSVSGQGAGGSYRPFRSDYGYVKDAAGGSTSDSYSIGVDIGIANTFHAGVKLGLTDVQTNSGDWSSENQFEHSLYYKGATGDPLYEKFYFKEANEKSVDSDPYLFTSVGGDNPERFLMDFSQKFAAAPLSNPLSYLEDQNGVVTPLSPDNNRHARDKRMQSISFISRSEYDNGFAIERYPNLCRAARPDHIAEVTSLGVGGSRYVYGIAAYNTKQVDATFDLGSTDAETFPQGTTVSSQAGLISYNPGVDNSTSNKKGLDYYFNKTEIPAYAHSYLLTSVLSPDYVDADNIRGPSDGDLGNYTRFVYKKIQQYKWRTPFEKNMASYNEGLKSNPQDDKGSYVYGEKELWYLDTIVTKNYIAIFYNSNRLDAMGVKDENGGYQSGLSAQMMKLDSIALYSKKDWNSNHLNAIAIKKVHFTYSYTLCPNVPNNINFINGAAANTGKLTLESLYFTYQNSNKAGLSPYVFQYKGLNPSYNMKGYDRWGNYKPNTATSLGSLGSGDANNYAAANDLPTSDFPYVIQDQTQADQNTSAWTMSDVFLPSGGHIKATYESDDYASVQDRRAMQMFKIIDYEPGSANPTDKSSPTNTEVDFTNGNQRFYFKLANGVTDMSQYLSGINELYFRFLINMRHTSGPNARNHYEYVSGYAPIIDSGIKNGFGWVLLGPVTLNDIYTSTYNPVLKASLQYGRINMSKLVWDDDVNAGDNSSFGLSLIQAMINSNSLRNMIQAAEGPNLAVYNQGVAHTFIAGKSWIRLNNPNNKKLGGGARVKKIEMIDVWGDMVGNANETFNYGQEYSYANDDGTSSGVASYEPQLGGDENPWRLPVFYDEHKLLIPDDQHYMEQPFGESFFPSPGVGYAKVTVRNLQRPGVKRHATGKIVHEFYTAKDFPVIPQQTDINQRRDRSLPFGLASIFHVAVRDYETVTQGYSIELNDMHGKPKSEKVFQEDATTPISSVTYYYKSIPYKANSFRLQNLCKLINSDGTTTQADIGKFFDFVADVREESAETISPGLDVNLDDFFVGTIPLPVPALWPAFSEQRTRFRSATTTKVIQRFCILDSTVATDLGSTVATKNLAYDSETGDALLTQTTTNFNDNVYTLKYPAWWHYQSMGPAYQNIGLEQSLSFTSSGSTTISNAYLYYNEGDELEMVAGSSHVLGWVSSVSNDSVSVILKNGIPVMSGTYNTKVIRSGKRNETGAPMANITTLTNPLNYYTGLSSNVYEQVLQASAVEFGNVWRTYCDCFTGGGTNTSFTTNPYVLGQKGNWRPTKSYLHLTGRSQSKFDGNTNIRNDGVFTSYLPYYKLVGGKWVIDGQNWTYTSEVTEMTPQGQELENRDALGRYSAAEFGYNQTLATAVAANSRYKEIGADNFEDYGYSSCADNHFKFKGSTPTTAESHSGRNSLVVHSGTPVIADYQLGQICTDSSGCHLSLAMTSPNPTLSFIRVSGGTGPYTITKTIVNGSPFIKLLPSGDGIQIQSSLAWQISVTATDSKGCSVTKVFKKP
jgi:hypothetical protein